MGRYSCFPSFDLRKTEITKCLYCKNIQIFTEDHSPIFCYLGIVYGINNDYKDYVTAFENYENALKHFSDDDDI
jgi:hypothetical protein